MDDSPSVEATDERVDDRSPTHRREIRTTVDTVVAAGQLLSAPRKCRVWHEAWLADGLTIQQLAAVTPIPQSTLYDLTREMVADGIVHGDGTTDNNATVLRAADMQVFVSAHPEGIGRQFNIHSTLIGVIGRGIESGDVETFLERNNYTMLLEAITGVLTILDGDQTTAPELEEHLEWIESVDARLIEGHIAAILEREAEKPGIDWEFPEDPSIVPADTRRPA
ncbi:hypothetical protein [Halorubrum sp. DTA98]|uniref:hypothetical protein n=1 Tax=Halorubrum sp. DTA98 TaxID=3402163 RepID=UPI003AAACFE7